MDKPPRADIRGIQSGANFVQPAQARNYAQHLRDLAVQWDAAADLCERLRAQAPTGAGLAIEARPRGAASRTLRGVVEGSGVAAPLEVENLTGSLPLAEVR